MFYSYLLIGCCCHAASIPANLKQFSLARRYVFTFFAYTMLAVTLCFNLY
ncbi:hypothetical protein SAMN04487825_10558 [Prevotella sp. kh1p2]|nr:hypothetical protein SAMN04487825_10558 [Prevotella sp. kh1p2]SNU10824.1 hypothetical protein SAMN06298210_10566 [Prevotellaceae bacterium KH2P17]